MADDTLTVKALEKIAAAEAEIVRLKMFVNEADRLNGNEPRFGDVSAVAVAGTQTTRPAMRRYSPGEFFNKSFSGAARAILVDRYEAAGKNPNPASVEEIHEALAQGSFAFETSGVEAQKNSIKISLGKNSASFVKLPNSELFGLIEWYGKKPGKPGRKSALPVEEDASGFAEATANAGDEAENKLPVTDRAA